MKKGNMTITMGKEAREKLETISKRERRSLSGMIEWLILSAKLLIVSIMLFVSCSKPKNKSICRTEEFKDMDLTYFYLDYKEMRSFNISDFSDIAKLVSFANTGVSHDINLLDFYSIYLDELYMRNENLTHENN